LLPLANMMQLDYLKWIVMRKIILLFFTLSIIIDIAAQNVGIGTNEPANKMHIVGNLLVNTPTTATGTIPTGAQTKTMVNATTINFLAGDSTGRIYDPGGPAGNYLPNLLGNVNIPFATGAVGIEITAETMDLGTGDSLIIKETSSSTNYLLAVGNGYSNTGKWVFNSSDLYIIFKSNADANTGIGFSLLFKRLYDNSASLPEVSGVTGNALFFDTKNGSFRSGLTNYATRGIYSTAMGNAATASGNYSTATGVSTSASGNFSVAMGSTTLADGVSSVAMGSFTSASGNGSFAMGSSTVAGGNNATAFGVLTHAYGFSSTSMGYSTTASGDYSTASGNLTQAQGANSTALGYKTKAIGIKSAAFGDSTIASGDNATALGYHTLASDDYSTAMGGFTTASGMNSTAIGNGSIASGASATAMGYIATASGASSIATGYVTTASGASSTAMGALTTASGNNSTAMGAFTTASGGYSTAMGYNASTNGQTNSFAIGGTGAPTNCTSPNQFMTRFDNYTFWISASNYAYLLPSSNGWAYTSDKNKKERFEELDGEIVLKKISGINFSSWNFKATDTKQYRHYGITAQDFYNAFGRDSYGNIGNDTTVSPLDLLGVAYSAIKALEKRSSGLLQDNKQLKEENALLQKNMDEIKEGLALANSELNKKLALLEAMVNELAALKEKKAVAPNTVAIRND
jgi:hypothetical protein